MMTKITRVRAIFGILTISIVLSGLALIAAAPASASIEASDLIGTWRLVSVESVRPNGETTIEWMGLKPNGVIIYLEDHTMSVQMMRDPRPEWTATSFDKASPEERIRAFDGYYAYYGRWDFDAANSVMRHRIEGSLRPTEVGIIYERKVTRDGGLLVLSTPLREVDGEQRFNRLIWKRSK